MAKTTKTAPVFAIGDRVFVRTAATLDTDATGTLENTTKSGWFVIRLDDSNSSDVLASAKNGIVSARISSLSHIVASPAPSSIAGQLASANAPKPAPEAKQPKAPKPAPKLPTECPECESSELETETDEEGRTTVSCCGCGWEETIEPDADHASRMAEALRQARQRYKKDKRPDGSATAHCDDAIARELLDKEPKETAELADRVLQQPIGFHYGKYEHLNNGQIRMNSGNRIRAYWKKINEDGNADEIADEIGRVARLLNLETDEV